LRHYRRVLFSASGTAIVSRPIAARAIRSWSAALVYRSTSRSVPWPLMAAISFALQPASARRRHAALRSPCAESPLGISASSWCPRTSTSQCSRRERPEADSVPASAPINSLRSDETTVPDCEFQLQTFHPRRKGPTMRHDPETYRRHAEECRQLAKTMSDEHRLTLLAMAESWIELAQSAERLKSRE
jgi:hypothetical protein